jgi:hypothetical protein
MRSCKNQENGVDFGHFLVILHLSRIACVRMKGLQMKGWGDKCYTEVGKIKQYRRIRKRKKARTPVIRAHVAFG